jgi:hypothetical protein
MTGEVRRGMRPATGAEKGVQVPSRQGAATEVAITPSGEQYRRLVHDLDVLRAAGAESNTAAIIDAVHQAANKARTMGETPMPRQRKSAPGPAPGGQS